MEGGCFVPGVERWESTPYKGKSLWANIMVCTDKTAVEYILRVDGDFNREVPKNASVKLKAHLANIFLASSAFVFLSLLDWFLAMFYDLLAPGPAEIEADDPRASSRVHGHGLPVVLVGTALAEVLGQAHDGQTLGHVAIRVAWLLSRGAGSWLCSQRTRKESTNLWTNL